jgi:hypothetical protein
VHLRARNRRPLTIQSYLETGRHFAAYLAERGMPTQPARITREHVEAYLADATDRGLAATTVARFYRNRGSCTGTACRRRPAGRMRYGGRTSISDPVQPPGLS